jgi:hypothetical protein
MVRLRLNDPTLTSDLVTFLRRCQCEVEQLAPTTLGVGLGHGIDVDAALQQLPAGRCYLCGAEIELFLSRLGSPLCLDCRHGLNEDAPGPVEEGSVREEWARMEVEAYLRVWLVLHPEGRVELVG